MYLKLYLFRKKISDVILIYQINIYNNKYHNNQFYKNLGLNIDCC